MRLPRLLLAMPAVLVALLLFAFGVERGSTAVLLASLLFFAIAWAIATWRRKPRTRTAWIKAEIDDWDNLPATEKQKANAQSLGIKFPKNISTGDMSTLISKRTGRRE